MFRKSTPIAALFEGYGGWVTIPITGPRPHPRSWPTMAAIGHTLYLYGGYRIDHKKTNVGAGGCFADFWSLDLSVFSSKYLEMPSFFFHSIFNSFRSTDT